MIIISTLFDKYNYVESKNKKIDVKIIPFVFAICISLLLLISNVLFNFTIQKDNSRIAKPTFKSISDGSYSKSLSKVYSDNFIFNKYAKSFTNTIKKNYGINPINDIFITNDRLIYNVQTQNTTTAENNSKSISEFTKKYSKNIDCYFGLVPTASEIYKNDLPSSYNTLNQSKFISDMYNEVSNSTIDVFSILSSQKNNYIFYNTDSSITSLGGYYVYSAIISAMGKTPIPIDRFDIEHTYHNFLGDLYSQILIKPEYDDIIDLFHYNGFNVVDKVIKYDNSEQYTNDSIFFKNNLQTSNKLNVYLGSPSPITEIQTLNIGSDNILIFKDNLTNILMQFLPLHFSNITLVDLDLISEKEIEQLDLNNFDAILFLYDIDYFNNNTSIYSKLSLLL